MSNESDPDLIKVTEVFLIPSSFIVAALGTADTNAHRAGVSLIGLVVSILWWISSSEALSERRPPQSDVVTAKHSRRIRIMYWMPSFFVVVWIVSLVAHLILWGKPLGH